MMLYLITTSDDELNYRDGPGKHYRKLGSLPSGVIVTGTGLKGWVQTTLQGETCYLSMEYLHPVEPSGVLCYTPEEIRQVITWLEGLL